jgi:hypothetical protein
MLCQYKDIFGKVGEDAHSYRILNIAIVDVALTVIVGYVIYLTTNKKYQLKNILIVLFLLGIVMHRIFCVRTTIDKLLFN